MWTELLISIGTAVAAVWLFRWINEAEKKNIKQEDYFRYKQQLKDKATK